MNDLEIAKALTDAATQLVKDSFLSVADGINSKLKTLWGKAFEDYKEYGEQVYLRNSHVRLLCSKEKDVPLYDVYVNSTFKQGDTALNDEHLIHLARERKKLIIAGNGGAGKTFFMRHLWMTLTKEPGDLLPVFIELRALNDLSAKDITSFIRATIAGKNEDLFNHFCKIGRFCFILDGFDEVQDENKDKLQKDILKFSLNYPRCGFVVSSRPDQRFSGWQGFTVFAPCPMDLAQARLLASKIPIEKESKKIFLDKLNSDFFRRHQSFLSNPLLCIMMMMTFKENMDIPSSMNIFYDRAFNALFVWHDATKAYRREKILDIQQFQRSFSVFCLLTYLDEKYTFSKSDIISYIDQSNKILKLPISSDDILKEYVERVNLMQIEGLLYTFIHRSFQEYFASYAIVHEFSDLSEGIFEKIARRAGENVISLAYDFNPEIVIQKYVSPRHEQIIKPILGASASRKTDYEIVEAGEIVCHFRMTPHKSGKLSFMFYTYNAAIYFIESVSKLGKRNFSIQLFPASVIEIIEKIGKSLAFSPEDLKDSSFNLSFTASGVTCSVDNPELPETKLEDMSVRFTKSIEAHTSVFDQFASDIAAAIKSADHWCQARFRESKQRSKSAAQLLGLV